jgi:hypothetical protein
MTTRGHGTQLTLALMLPRPPAPPRATSPQSPAQQRAMKALRETKKVVRSQASSLADLDWTGACCSRCPHACSGTHRPGHTGRCKALGCGCLYADVTTACGHQASDYEAWGVEAHLQCSRCGDTDLGMTRQPPA